MYLYIPGNFTTNLAECWMNMRAKFDGGKQYNRSQRGSWEGRCAGAGLRHNIGPDWGPITWENITGKEANPVFATTADSYAVQVARDRKRKASEEVKTKRLAKKYQKTNDDSVKARRDYARHDDGVGVQEVDRDLPGDMLQNIMSDYYRAYVRVSPAQLSEVELSTRGQGSADESTSNRWKAERRKRITSSSCGQIAKRRSTTKVANLVKTLLYSTFRGNAATQWGHDQEEQTKRAYLQQKRTASPDISVKESGLVVHLSHHWFAASPDGLVHDPASLDQNGVVEYKNPYSVRKLTLLEAITHDKNFCLVHKDGSFHLKRTHTYYYQVQATMFCTGTKWCDFVVRTTVDQHTERILFDSQFWKNAFHRIQTFYFTAVLPELASPRLQKGGIREPSQWLQDFKAWEVQFKEL